MGNSAHCQSIPKNGPLPDANSMKHAGFLVSTYSKQPFDGHTLRYASSITDDGARADIQAKGFWGTSHQRASLMSRYLTHTHNPTRGFSSLPVMPIMNESNSTYMSRGSIKLSWHPSLHSFSAPLERHGQIH